MYAVGDDGVLYIQGSNGFWLPTTSRNGQTVVMTKSVYVDMDAMPHQNTQPPTFTPPPTAAPELPPGWSRSGS